jgi:hypothetical protein
MLFVRKYFSCEPRNEKGAFVQSQKIDCYLLLQRWSTLNSHTSNAIKSESEKPSKLLVYHVLCT